MIRPLDVDEVLQLPVVVDLATAGRAVGIGRTKIHELARRGELPFPVLRLGSSYRVRRRDLLDLLAIPERTTSPGSTSAAGLGVYACLLTDKEKLSVNRPIRP